MQISSVVAPLSDRTCPDPQCRCHQSIDNRRRRGRATKHCPTVNFAVKIAAYCGEQIMPRRKGSEFGTLRRGIRTVVRFQAHQARRDHLRKRSIEIGNAKRVREHRHTPCRAHEAHGIRWSKPFAFRVCRTTPAKIACEGVFDARCRMEFDKGAGDMRACNHRAVGDLLNALPL